MIMISPSSDRPSANSMLVPSSLTCLTKRDFGGRTFLEFIPRTTPTA